MSLVSCWDETSPGTFMNENSLKNYWLRHPPNSISFHAPVMILIYPCVMTLIYPCVMTLIYPCVALITVRTMIYPSLSFLNQGDPSADHTEDCDLAILVLPKPGRPQCWKPGLWESQLHTGPRASPNKSNTCAELCLPQWDYERENSPSSLHFSSRAPGLTQIQ